jgi:hypothetical protein
VTATGEEITLSVALGTMYLLRHYRRTQLALIWFYPWCSGGPGGRTEMEMIVARIDIGNVKQRQRQSG